MLRIFCFISSIIILFPCYAQQITASKGHDGPISELRFTPDGASMISASLDGSVRSWKIPSLSPLWELHFDSPVIDIALSVDGRMMAVLTKQEISLHHFDTEEEPKSTQNTNFSKQLCFSPDGSMLALAGKGIQIRMLPELEVRESPEYVTEPYLGPNGVAFS